MIRLFLLVALSAMCLFATCVDAEAQTEAKYPVPKNLGDPATLGKGVQRTMALLANSTPTHRNTVRILFYGQSITERDWWHQVADDLRRRFPNANLIVENRALGGYSSQLLVGTAETDLYPFYPDLLIFHVYGSHTAYEDIIRRTRERTTAEVLIQTDHVANDADLNEETDPAKIHQSKETWNSFMNYQFLPGVAQKYGYALLDQRNLWKQYLRDNHLHARELLADGIHQNDFGNYLMAQIVSAYLVRRTDYAVEAVAVDPLNNVAVRTFPVGKELQWHNGEITHVQKKDVNAFSLSVQWHDGKLTLPFVGNRVDVILRGNSSKAPSQPVEVLVDGVKPSATPVLYGFTRALSTPGGKWPVILKIGSEKPLLLEEWTMQVRKDPANPKRFTFTLAGSKTGEDGTGSSDTRFVSKSGRIVIEPADWGVEYALALPGIKPVPDTFTVRWQVVPYFHDTITAPEKTDPTVESVVTVAQGLENREHTLTIESKSPDLITAIRVYKPIPPRSHGIDVPVLSKTGEIVGWVYSTF